MAGSDNEKAVFSTEIDISGGEMDNYRAGLLAEKAGRRVSFYSLPLAVSMIKGLGAGAKMLFAKLGRDAWSRDFCRTGVGSLAKSLRTDRPTIRRRLRKLERLGLIKIVHERKRCCYHLARKYRGGPSIPLLAEIVERSDLGPSEKLHVCLLLYREGANGCTWEFQKQIASDLGCSVRTTRRALRAIKGRCEVDIRPRRWNRKWGHKYSMTLGAVESGRIFGDNSHRTECTHLYKKRKARSVLDAWRQKFLRRDLSKEDFWQEESSLMLTGAGVNEKVAWPMAFEQRIPFESVAQAKNNGLILRARLWQQARDAGQPKPWFSLPGYVVAALNGARKAGKIIGTTKLYREAGAMYRKQRQRPVGGTKRKISNPKIWVKRKRKLLRQVEFLKLNKMTG